MVWLQIRLRDLAIAADSAGQPMPPLARRYMTIWFCLGWPAFLAFMAIFYLMVAKPA